MDDAAYGNDDAFARLATMSQDRLYRLALANGLKEADAADAARETLARAYENRDKWKAGSRAMSWLYGIGINVVREQRRKLGRTVLGLDISSLPCPPDNHAETERLAILADAIEKLPERQREIVTCRYLRQMDVRTTAEVLECAEGTVKAATSAALNSLRQLMVNSHE